MSKPIFTEGDFCDEGGYWRSRNYVIERANAKIFPIVHALTEAIENCPCSVPERLSGHRIGCGAPEWQEILDSARGGL